MPWSSPGPDARAVPPLGRRHCQLAAGIVYGCNLSFGYNPPRRRQPPGIAEMGIVEKTQAAAPSRLADVDRFRLRRFVEGLGRRARDRQRGRSTSPTSRPSSKAIPRRCCSARSVRSVRNWSAMSPAAARGSPAPSASSRTSSLPEVQRRLRNKPEMVEVSRAEAPAQEVVLTGDDADLTTLPVHLAARRRRRALYLRLDRLRDRSEDRLDQCRRAPPDAARPPRGRRRSRLAERSARDLRGERRRRQAAAGELRGRRASDRPCRRGDAAAGRRARPRRVAARRAARRW